MSAGSSRSRGGGRRPRGPWRVRVRARAHTEPLTQGKEAIVVTELPFMVKKKKGTIVNVSSIATRSIHRVPYAAAKGGVNALTASIAMEQSHNGIRINATYAHTSGDHLMRGSFGAIIVPLVAYADAWSPSTSGVRSGRAVYVGDRPYRHVCAATH